MASAGKVLIIVENLPLPFDRRVWMEATTLRAAGYEVSIICPVGKGFEEEYEQLEGIDIYRHPLPDDESSVRAYLKEYWCALKWEFRLAKKIWKEKSGFNIIHICNPPDLLFLVTLKYKIFHGVKVIYDQHDLNPELYLAKFERKDIFYFVLLMFERITFRLADKVISTNESHRKIALERGNKLVDAVHVVRSGPDLDLFKKLPANDIYRKGKKYLVGYVGVMGEPEGLDTLLKSVEYIIYDKQIIDVRFMLIGSGPVIENLKKMANELNISDYVEFTGRVSDDELIERISSADVCVNSDPKTDFTNLSTMNKILEYMALGKPIVQFDMLEGRRSAGGASLYAEPNSYIDFADKIIMLLSDEEMAKKMGCEGRKRMEEGLSWNFQRSNLLRVYDELA